MLSLYGKSFFDCCLEWSSSFLALHVGFPPTFVLCHRVFHCSDWSFCNWTSICCAYTLLYHCRSLVLVAKIYSFILHKYCYSQWCGWTRYQSFFGVDLRLMSVRCYNVLRFSNRRFLLESYLLLLYFFLGYSHAFRSPALAAKYVHSSHLQPINLIELLTFLLSPTHVVPVSCM